MIKIFVIEDDKNRHEQLVLMLKDLFPQARVQPAHNRPCRNWRQADNLVDQSPSSGDLIFLVDLALDGGEPRHAEDGIEHARRIRQLRPKAFLIAATLHVHLLHNDQNASKIFDAILDKAQPVWKDYEKLKLLLNKTVEEIRRKRANVKSPGPVVKVKYKDSLGMRLIEAIFGLESLHELVSETTKDWSDISVEALSAGFSGSHILRLDGHKFAQPAGRILKISAQKTSLQREAQAPKEHAEILHAFAGCMGELVGEVSQLGQKQVFYLIQASVPGRTLYNVFENSSKNQALKALRPLLQLLIKQYEHAVENATKDIAVQYPTAQRSFGFQPDHPYRIYHSCDDLQMMGDILVQRKEWPKSIRSPRHIFGAVRSITENWTEHLSEIRVPFWACQHGDLHPGNVIVFGDNQLRFIDFARLGPWPIGYDVSRMATQSRIFLTDNVNHQDWVVNGLSRWTKEGFAMFNRHDDQLCPWAMQCDQAYQRFIETCPASERKALQQIYELGALSDLLRIISYQNISIYKRIWAGIACWQLATRLGFVNA